jgi:hypothetical protein
LLKAAQALQPFRHEVDKHLACPHRFLGADKPMSESHPAVYSALNVRRADLATAKVNAVCDGQEYPGNYVGCAVLRRSERVVIDEARTVTVH